MDDDLTSIVRRLYDGVWNDDDPAIADELVAEDYVIHDRELAEDLRGPALYRELARSTRAIFPDMRIEIEDLVVGGDSVAVRWTMYGTQQGELFGVPPTGEAVEMSAIEINHFTDGLLVETWTQSDQLSLMRQVGAIPGSE